MTFPPSNSRRPVPARTGFPIIGFLGGALLMLLALTGAGRAGAAASDPPADMPLLFASDFNAPDALEKWTPTDPKAWRIADETEGSAAGSKVLSLHGKSDYKPEVRSPLNIAWLEGVEAGDFVFEAKLRSTTRNYDHRDMCLFFGKQDASHFYYVHFGLRSDPHSNSIFLVNGAPRVSIAAARPEGTKWTEDYHRIRIVRKVATGTIEVYFDDMEKPAMTATDTTFGSGAFGVGSFDDTGNVAEVKIWGRATEAAPRP